MTNFKVEFTCPFFYSVREYVIFNRVTNTAKPLYNSHFEDLGSLLAVQES